MRKISVLVFLLVVFLDTPKVQAYFYFGAGADLSFYQLRKLNKVIDRFNNTHGDRMIDKLENVDYLIGPSAVFGNVSKRGFTFEISWKTNLKKINSTYELNGENYNREVRVRYHEVGPGMGYTFTNLGAFRPSFLGFINTGTISEYTRSSVNGNLKDESFERVHRELHVGFTLMGQIMIAGVRSPIGISIRPYYHIGFLKIDHSKLNEVINDINTNGTENYKDNNNYFGLQLLLIFKNKG